MGCATRTRTPVPAPRLRCVRRPGDPAPEKFAGHKLPRSSLLAAVYDSRTRKSGQATSVGTTHSIVCCRDRCQGSARPCLCPDPVPLKIHQIQRHSMPHHLSPISRGTPLAVHRQAEPCIIHRVGGMVLRARQSERSLRYATNFPTAPPPARGELHRARHIVRA